MSGRMKTPAARRRGEAQGRGPDPQSRAAALHYGLGSLLSFWGCARTAAQAFGDAAEACPSFAEAHFRRAEALSRVGAWLEAAHGFRESARLRPWDAEAQGNLVLALGRAGRWADAELALSRMLRLRPGDADLYVLLGAIRRRRGDVPGAIRAFRWAVRTPPQSAGRRLCLGEALFGGKAWDEALRARDDAAASSASSRPYGFSPAHTSVLNRSPLQATTARPEAIGAAPGAHAPSARRRFATLRAALSGTAVTLALLLGPARLGAQTVAAVEPIPDAARQCARHAREAGVAPCREALSLPLSPKRATTMRILLMTKLTSLRRWDELVALCRDDVRARPDDADAHFRLAAALLNSSGAVDEAASELQEAVRLAPDLAPAHGLLGEALNMLGRHVDAVVAFDVAVRLAPDFLDLRPGAREIYEASKRGVPWP
jgi:tetratricopeptide (TPR) repeat protein